MKSTRFAIIVIIIISLIGKVFGFIRELLLANYFGTSSIVDIYLMSVTIPAILFGFLPAVGTAFTPAYFEIETEQRRNDFLNKVVISCMIFSFLCIIVTCAFSRFIVNICAPGFDEQSKLMTSSFLKVTVWSVLFNTPIQILAAYLNCKKRYINSNISTIIVSVTQAIFVVLAAKINPLLLTFGFVIPYVIQFMWLSYSSYRLGFRPFLNSLNEISINRVFVLALPIAIGNILVDLNGFVDKFLSSSLSEGRLSALNYAFTLRSIFITIPSSIIATVFYPKISELINKMDKERVTELISKIINWILIVFIPISMICIIFAKDEIQLVFMRGSFDYHSLELTVYPFIMYIVSLVIIVLRELIIRVMYAYGIMKKNLYYGASNIGLNIVLSVVLVNATRLEHIGLALATSIADIVSFPLYIFELKKIIHGFSFKRIEKNVIKVVLSSIVMCCIGCFIRIILTNYFAHSYLNLLFIFIVSICVGTMVYLIMIYVLKVEEYRVFANKLFLKM